MAEEGIVCFHIQREEKKNGNSSMIPAFRNGQNPEITKVGASGCMVMASKGSVALAVLKKKKQARAD